MRHKFNIVFFFIVIFLKGALALGSGAEGFDAVCKVTIHSRLDKALLGLCTGTLVDSGTVQTAAHCIFDQAYYVVECGYKSSPSRSTGVKTKTGAIFNNRERKFKETFKVMSAKKMPSFFDKAKLSLDRPSKLRPAKIQPFLKLTEMVKNEQCYFAGYGMGSGREDGQLSALLIGADNLVVKKSGNTFSVEMVASESTLKLPILSLSGSPVFSGLGPGDSGSSIICKNENDIYSFGIASKVGLSSKAVYLDKQENVFSFSSAEDLEVIK